MACTQHPSLARRCYCHAASCCSEETHLQQHHYFALLLGSSALLQRHCPQRYSAERTSLFYQLRNAHLPLPRQHLYRGSRHL